MRRFHIAVLAALATLALGAVAVPVASASNGTTVPPKTNSLPALKTVPIHGVAKNGKQFNGTYAIQRYVARAHKAYAVGTLKGTLKGRQVTRYNVMMPASLTGAAARRPDRCAWVSARACVRPGPASTAVTAPAVRVVASTMITAITTTQDAKIDISVNDHKAGAWYTSPVWIAIGIIALVLIIALIAMAGRGRDTTVIK